MRAGSKTLKAMRRRGSASRLTSLYGEPLTDKLASDAQHLAQMSPGALNNLWDVLEPCLLQPMTHTLEQALSSYCDTYDTNQTVLGHLIRVLSTLLRGAASVALPREGFAADLEAVWPGQTEAHAVFLERYDAVTAALRKTLLTRALSAHGNVLTDIEWRVDQVVADKASPRLALPVAIVTFGYRHRDEHQHITLQLTGDELKRASVVLAALAEQVERLMPEPEKAAAEQPEQRESDAPEETTHGAQ